MNHTPSILQLDYQGQPNKWIGWQTAVTRYAKGQVAWSAGVTEFVVRGGVNRITGIRSEIRTASIIAVHGINKTLRRKLVPSLNNRELFRRDQHRCAYCYKIFGEISLTRDHIVPRSRGGQDNWMNVVTACMACNQKKKDYLLEECGLQLHYTPFVPNMFEHMILSNPCILDDQRDFLLNFVPPGSRLLSGKLNPGESQCTV